LKIDILMPRGTAPPVTGPGAPVPPVRAAEPVRPVATAQSMAQLVADGELGAALRRELPRQGSPMPLLADLAWLNGSPDGERVALPAAVRQAVADAWRALAMLSEVARPGELERAARASGIGLERLLATADPAELDAALSGDWKAQLLKLRAALGTVPRRHVAGPATRTEAPLPGRPGALPALEPVAPTLPELPDATAMAGQLADELDAAISRVTSHQLANLRDPAHAPYAVLEVPLRHDAGATLLRLRFAQENTGSSAEAAAPSWSVEFAVHLGAAGQLQGRVQLSGNRIDVTVASTSAAMLEALRAAEGELRWQLESIGLEIDRLDWRRPNSLEPESGSSWLVDERA
jgi:hypothetical protein